MKKLNERVNEGIPELFKIAGRSIDLAKRIYNLSNKALYSPEMIIPYFKSREDNVFNLAALIAMDNFEVNLKIPDLVNFQKSSDSMTRARARIIAVGRKCECSDFATLLTIHTFSECRESADLSRLLLLMNFEGQIAIELLLKFQESVDETIREVSRKQLLSIKPGKFVYKTLENNLKHKDPHVSSLSAELMLNKLPEQLSWRVLVEMQAICDATNRNLARILVFGISKDQIQKERLKEYTFHRNQNIRDVAIELILKNFDYMLTGKEILELQKSPNPIIRGLSRDVALSLPPSRWFGPSTNSIKKAMSSHHFELRKLAVELNIKLNGEDELEKEARIFLAKYGF